MTVGPVCAFDAVDVLDELITVRNRSPTLRGDAPVRAVQACGPYYEGCGYGLELVYHGLGLEVRPPETIPEERLAMLDPLSPEFDYAGAIEEVVRRGLLRRSRRWHRRLARGWWWTDDEDARGLEVWTGLLIKPRAGILLRVTDLFNAPNLGISIREQVIHDSAAWTPLTVAFETRRSESRVVIRGPFASLAPVAAGARVATALLRERPEIGERVIDFYSPEYFEQKASDPPTRKYVRMIRGASSPEVSPIEETTSHVVLSHPDQHRLVRIEDFRGCLTSSDAEVPAPEVATQQAVLAAACSFRFHFTGRSFDIEVGEEWRAEYGATVEEWRRLYGAAGAACQENLTLGGETCVVTGAGAPLLMFTIEPLLRFSSPPGWSLLFEGTTTAPFHGLRGIVWSDLFHAGAFAFQFFERPEPFTIEAGSPLGRVVPVPRSLVVPGYEIAAL